MPLITGRFRVFLDALQGSYWLLPALMGLGAVLLAVVTQIVDPYITAEMRERWGSWVTAAGPDGARAMLTTIAASMMTLASLTYSLTLVALTLAAGQYGPRLLRTFMRDRVTQVSLGAFLATFIYCLAALRTVGSTDQLGSVPHLGLAISGLMATACLAYLVYFVHHVASSINATSVVLAVHYELMAAIDASRSEGAQRADADLAEPSLPHTARPIPGRTTGYVTVTDIDVLTKLCDEHDTQIWLAVRPGDFVLDGEPVAYEPGHGSSLAGRLDQAIVVGQERTMLQDLEFGVAQLVEVALRALSPGINDPFTAILCVDRLSAAFVALADREPVAVRYRGTAGQVRVTRLRRATFDGALRAAFDPLRQAARGHVAVLIRLAEALGRTGRAIRHADQREAVGRQLEMIAAGTDAIPEARDRDDLLQAVRVAAETLAPSTSPAAAS